ncbi:hypothetical protein QYF50_13645 [Paenibacillus vini]|uniref:hypothetical protein n=1 Tax=Paenibacillus vini TaxID=1476024 RepID=UPI0025B64905|nr:hypothetical protein [Paenibacillus vini]MDN4068941.1 hypothetical protein [Paenibacillus vini]
MLNITFILVSASLISWLELPRMIREGERREIWGFSVFLLIGIGLSLAQSFITEIPTPLIWITMIVKPFSDLLSAIGLIQ